MSFGLYACKDGKFSYSLFHGSARLKKIIIDTIAVYSEYQTETDRSEDALVNRYAVSEFSARYSEITGNALSVTYINNTSELDENKNYFIFGGSLALTEGLNYNGLTTDTGYVIAKRNNNVYIYGKTGYGNLNAVYGLLEQTFGLKFYTDTVYDYDLSIFNFYNVKNIVFNPSIDYNWAYDGALTCLNEAGQPNWEYQHRLGFVNSWQILGSGWHSFLTVLPKSEYGAAHPQWYRDEVSTDGNNTQFTTLNLAYNNFEMARFVADNIYALILYDESESNYKSVYAFGPPDIRGWSTSDESNAIKSEYGTNSAEYILFMNKVAEFLENKSLTRNIKLAMLAYNNVYEAPEYNENLKFYKGLKVSLGVMIAPIEANMYRSLSDGTAAGNKFGYMNAYYYNQLMNWKQFGGEIYFWRYSAYFDNYFVPLDSISNMRETYRLLAENGVSQYIDLGQVGDETATDWSALKIYLKGQLAKTVNADVNTLIEDFCKAYYGAGWENMISLLSAEQSRYKIISDMSVSDNDGKDAIGCYVIRDVLFNKKYWDDTPTTIFFTTTFNASMLKNWYEKITAAITAVNSDASLTNEQKALFIKRINIEGIAIRYMILAVYGDTTYDSSFSVLGTYAKSLGIDIFAEGAAWTSDGEIVDGNIENLA